MRFCPRGCPWIVVLLSGQCIVDFCVFCHMGCPRLPATVLSQHNHYRERRSATMTGMLPLRGGLKVGDTNSCLEPDPEQDCIEVCSGSCETTVNSERIWVSSPKHLYRATGFGVTGRPILKSKPGSRNQDSQNQSK